MYTAYFADTGNLYTFYCNQLIYKYDADGKLTYCNNGRIPTATLNNIGPGLNLVGPTGNFAFFSLPSKLVLMFDMLAGRLELFPMIVLFAPSTWKK